MSTVVTLVNSEQVVNPYSKQAVVMPEAVPVASAAAEGGQPVAIKMGVVTIKWAWLEKYLACALCAVLS